jgi:bacterioferritin-associated ferredoxin
MFGVAMFICNCRGLNEQKVKEAACTGVKKWQDIHSYYGTEPSCGKCSEEIRQIISEQKDVQVGKNLFARLSQCDWIRNGILKSK